MKKRIAVFSLAYYPCHVSGAEAAIKEITERISPEDIEFHVITLLFDTTAPRTEVMGNVTVHRVGFGGAYLSKILFVFLAARTARALHTESPLAGMWAMMTYMTMPLTLARWIGVKVSHVVTFQDGDPYDKVFERWFIKPALPLIDSGIKNAAVIQAISEYLATWPEKRGYTGEVVLVRNGANPKNFDQYYGDAELETVKESLGKKEGDVYLFIAARLVYQKGIDAVVRALTLLPENVHFLIGGGGPDEAILKALAAELGVSERVKFLGQLERDDVPKYRNTIVSDIFVHPSRSEGLGNSVLSAMAGRLPVIASNVGGLKDFVFDEAHNPNKAPTAWVVEPDAPEQIAKAVEDILTHPEKVAEVTANARKLMETEYHWDAVAKKMREEVFSKVVD
ncbi:MAG: glycosyltransferase family 4 protein [Candidatus Saccharibacteria bacterium]|nr:glycosyltransferase family 4 protein [Candidatus Saccharibacteria bacterium]MCA9358055.1 glycosyltransferase family 4 protein [Candidatus Kaiserbacteria bacterium]USN88980.1 MAG: glycosyltransferase family 4 protein [Candidatus Nomurabacteria bacterium]